MKDIKLTISTIRNIRDRIIRLVGSWTDFEAQDVKILELGQNDPRHSRWDGHLSAIRGHIRQLQSYEVLLSQKLELFNGMSNSVRNLLRPTL